MAHLPRIAYVSVNDPRSVRSWSGNVYHIWRSLADMDFQIDLVGPLIKGPQWRLRLNKRLVELRGRHFLSERSPEVLKDLARQAEMALSGRQFDLVLSPGILPVSHLQCAKPIVTWTDATFDGMVDYYPRNTQPAFAPAEHISIQ